MSEHMIYEPIFLDVNSEVPMYRQLYGSIKERICSGCPAVGEKMPSIRRISEELGVSRTTVEQAYGQLCVEGYLVSRPQSGYFVEAAVIEKTVILKIVKIVYFRMHSYDVLL